VAIDLEFARRPPQDYTIVAVAGIVQSAAEPGSYLMIQNYRGWDIPGGRLEPGETPEAAFTRELTEETGYTVTAPPQELALLELRDNPSLGVIIYTAVARKAGERTALEEIYAVEAASPEAIIAAYFGDKVKLRTLFAMAAEQ
jgi:8-oxo-dGTP pyrophosphatase MutT (NUDIX family)